MRRSGADERWTSNSTEAAARAFEVSERAQFRSSHGPSWGRDPSEHDEGFPCEDCLSTGGSLEGANRPPWSKAGHSKEEAPPPEDRSRSIEMKKEVVMGLPAGSWATGWTQRAEMTAAGSWAKICSRRAAEPASGA